MDKNQVDNKPSNEKQAEDTTALGTRCGAECHYKYDDGSECGGHCTRLGGRLHEGSHSCSNGSSHDSW